MSIAKGNVNINAQAELVQIALKGLTRVLIHRRAIILIAQA